MRPDFKMATRSATRSRSEVMCVEKRTVRRPGSARSMIICKNCRRAKRIETGGRLVQHQQFRLVAQRQQDRHLL